MKMCRCPEWTNHLMQMNQSTIAALTDKDLLRYIPDNNTGEDGLAAVLIEIADRWRGASEEDVEEAEERQREAESEAEALAEEVSEREVKIIDTRHVVSRIQEQVTEVRRLVSQLEEGLR